MAADAVRGIEEEVVRFGIPPPVQRAGGRARAASVPVAPAQRQSATPKKVTLRERCDDALKAARAGVHVTGQLPSIAAQHARVHEAAAEWEHWFPKYGRIAWGYFHLVVVKSPLNVVEWVTETFPRFVVVVVLAAVAWKFH